MYEEWLSKQAMFLEAQVKTFETSVNKLKRQKKTIQARQRLVSIQNLSIRDTFVYFLY